MDKIAVLDFGGQYAHLIANRIRRIGVYSDIFEGDVEADTLKEFKGIVLSGGPASVSAPDSFLCDKAIFELGIPILGICYGHQLVAHMMGGKVEKGKVREYGEASLNVDNGNELLANIKDHEQVWMSHFDQVMEMPEGFQIVASTSDCPVAAMMNSEKQVYGLQFHPEVTHTPCGMTILENFVKITGAKKEWNIDNYIEQIEEEIKEKVGDKKVFLMISGGVDSTVAFLLLAKALGKERVYGLFVDTGFMRLNEGIEVKDALLELGVNLHIYDAKEEYFEALDGVYDPEKKRVIIGELFIDIQSKVSENLQLNPDEWLLGQGTIYPDTIETGGTKHAHKIKTHHNRVERVQKMIEEGKVIEPIAQLYKDEVRLVGKRLGLNEKMVERHPFPGPGLAVRCLCSEGGSYPENHEQLEKRINEMTALKDLKAVVLPINSVGVQGDERTYKNPVLLFGQLKSWSGLNSLSTHLTNQFPEINRVLLCLSPGSFEDLTVQKTALTQERILTTQYADKVVMDYIREADLYKDIWQFPTVLIPLSLNGQDGESVVLRPVCSMEAMTANFYQMPLDNLRELTKRLVTLEGVSGVLYDITNKPPGTIEWE